MAFCALLLLVLAGATAQAAGFTISPLRVQLSAHGKVVALNVRNTGAEPVSIQAELMEWSQPNGEDHYELTRELLASPPIFTVAAGESQVIRVGLRRPPDRDHELTYRLFLQELPPPIPEGFHGLRMVTRMSLPVFVAPAVGSAAHDLAWRASIAGDGALQLRAANTGNGHAQVTELRLHADGKTLEHSGNAYILPGADRLWALPAAARSLKSGDGIRLEARINGKDESVQLRLD